MLCSKLHRHKFSNRITLRQDSDFRFRVFTPDCWRGWHALGASHVSRLTFRHRYDVHRVPSSLLSAVDPSFRALSGRLKFTVRRHEFNTESLPFLTFDKCYRAGQMACWQLWCGPGFVSRISGLGFRGSSFGFEVASLGCRLLYEMCFNLKLSGNAVYYTASPSLVIFETCVINFIAREFSN